MPMPTASTGRRATRQVRRSTWSITISATPTPMPIRIMVQFN
ncbi:Uncharacterised protein [Bordetella pertussis]|nr:Uncharacterised protein [Bordetella pertussis]